MARCINVPRLQLFDINRQQQLLLPLLMLLSVQLHHQSGNHSFVLGGLHFFNNAKKSLKIHIPLTFLLLLLLLLLLMNQISRGRQLSLVENREREKEFLTHPVWNMFLFLSHKFILNLDVIILNGLYMWENCLSL